MLQRFLLNTFSWWNRCVVVFSNFFWVQDLIWSNLFGLPGKTDFLLLFALKSRWWKPDFLFSSKITSSWNFSLLHFNDWQKIQNFSKMALKINICMASPPFDNCLFLTPLFKMMSALLRRVLRERQGNPERLQFLCMRQASRASLKH